MPSHKFYIPMPSPQTPPTRSSSKPPMQRRPTLTPSTVTPPSLSAQTSSVRTERTQPSPDRASALLAKVASNPTSRKHTPVNSPLPSPADFDRSSDAHRGYMPYGGNDEVTRKAEWSRQMSSYGQQQQDGYISFPDFERFHQGCEPVTGAGTAGQERQSIKT